MAVVVKEIWDGEISSGKWDTGREYTKVFRVTSDLMSDDGIVASAAVGIDYYDEYFNTLSGTSDIFAHCDEIKIIKDGSAKSGRVQLVSCHFTTAFPFKEASGGAPGSTPADPSARDKNPSARPAVWTFDSILVRKARMFDLSTPPQAIVNTSNQWLQPPYEEELPLLNFKVTKSYSTSSLSLDTFGDFRNRCNDAVWKGFAAGEVKVENVSAQSAELENGFPYYSVTWSFVVDDYFHTDGTTIGWRPTEILNAGTTGYRAAFGIPGTPGYIPPIGTPGGLPVQLIDSNGTPCSAPVMLARDSRQLRVGEAPVFLQFNLVRQADFSTIPGI